jgi:hypothetical protein
MTNTLRIMRSRMAQTGVLVGALLMFMGTNDNNGCAPDPGGQGECSTASECSGDPGVNCVGSWACNAGECVFECGSEPIGCYGDQDCSGGLVCNAAEVCMSPPGCQPGAPCPAVCYGYCVAPEPPPTGCYSDGQCAAGQHCSVSDGVCDPPPGCGPGQDCPAVCYGACVPDQGGDCWSDQDCGYGEQCNTWDYCGWGGAAEYDADGARQADYACMGRCEAIAPSCDSNDDCGPGEICGCGYPGMPNGIVACLLQCIPDPNAQCSDANPCPAGLTCQGGTCVEQPEGCWSDYDCAPDQQCNTWDYCGVPGESFLIACQGVCEPRPADCHDDSQCGANQHCEVMCYDQACDCDPSYADCLCAGGCTGTCVDDPWQGCSSDDECGPNEYCGCGSGPYPGMPNGVMCMLECVPKPYECSSNAECASGQCNFVVCESGGGGTPTEPACDPADASCGDANKPAPYGQCYGYCEAPPEYDCQSDADCASGVCELVICEGSAAADPMPCLPDDSGDCFMPPPPPEGQCWGYCKDPGPQECGPDGSCPEGYYCGCGWPTYAADGSEAPSGVACFPMCIPEEPTCGSNSDCAPDQACVNGTCQAAGGECQSNSDCGANQHCELGPCPLGPCTFDPATGESWCPPCYGQCVDDGGGVCSSDAECAADQFCAIQYCVTACPACVPGAQCPPCETQCYGMCQDQQWPQECDSNSDCDAGESCQCTSNPACPECDACFFQCLPDSDPGECSSDADCGAGQQCDFICAPCAPPQEGMPPVECPCFGMCVDAPPPPATECQMDSDCDDGFYCEQGPCPYFMPCSPDTGCPGCGGTCQKQEPEPNPCMRTGCSGQVCAAQPVATTCEWNDSYACYQLAECGLNAAGVCGWIGNDAFSACLQGGTSGGGVPR